MYSDRLANIGHVGWSCYDQSTGNQYSCTNNGFKQVGLLNGCVLKLFIFYRHTRLQKNLKSCYSFENQTCTSKKSK